MSKNKTVSKSREGIFWRSSKIRVFETNRSTVIRKIFVTTLENTYCIQTKPCLNESLILKRGHFLVKDINNFLLHHITMNDESGLDLELLMERLLLN